MAKNKPGGSVGGFVFNFFNIGFTVVMFLLPTAGLVYWYLYIRAPGGPAAQAPQVTVQQQAPRTKRPAFRSQQANQAADSGPPITSGFFNAPATSSGTSQQSRDDVPTSPAPPTRKEYELRNWQDTTGKFSIEARFYSASSDKVKLAKSDDTQIEVPIAKLSDDDKQYIRDIFRAKGIQPRF